MTFCSNNLACVSVEEPSPAGTTQSVEPQTISFRSISLLAISLFAFTLFLRTWQLAGDYPQPDEISWIERSSQTLKNIREGRYSRFNEHLGHPGVIPSSLYSAVEWLVVHNNTRLSSLPSDNPESQRPRLDRLTYARFSNALIASLTPTLLFLGTYSLLGPLGAFLGAGLLATLPGHLAASRLAHLDAILALLTMLSALCYVKGEISGRLRLKIAAGLFWGAAIATKPTALFLIPALWLYRVYRRRTLGEPWEKAIFSWADIWCFIIGHLFLISVFSRLWHPDNRYVRIFHIDNQLTHLVQAWGDWVHHFPAAVLFLSLTVAVSAVVCLRHRARRNEAVFHTAMTSLVGALLFFFVGIFPVISANVIRFWCWTFGLTEMKHQAYGKTIQAPSGGYGELLLTRLPLVTLIGLILFAAFSLSGKTELKKESNKETRAFTVLSLAIVFFWILPLSLSDKQTIRYLLPPLVFICLLAGMGFAWILRLLPVQLSTPQTASDTHALRARDFAHRWLIYLLLPSLIVALQFYSLSLPLAQMPYFRNSLHPGLSYDIDRGLPLAVAGTTEALTFLQSKSAQLGRPIDVMLHGDLNVAQFSNKRLFPNQKDRLRFHSAENSGDSDYIMTFPDFVSLKSDKQPHSAEIATKEVFSYKIQNTDVLLLHEIEPPDYHEPVEVSLNGSRHTGRLVKNELLTNPATQKAGYILFNQYLRMPQGRFNISFEASLDKGTPENQGANTFAPLSLSSPLITLKFSECETVFTTGDFLATANNRLHAICSFPAATQAQLRIFWHGKARLKISKLQVVRSE